METTTDKIIITICMGSSCFSRGNNQSIETIKVFIAENRLEEIIILKGSLCEGSCTTGSNMDINGKKYTNVTSNTVPDILLYHLDLIQ